MLVAELPLEFKRNWNVILLIIAQVKGLQERGERAL